MLIGYRLLGRTGRAAKLWGDTFSLARLRVLSLLIHSVCIKNLVEVLTLCCRLFKLYNCNNFPNHFKNRGFFFYWMPFSVFNGKTSIIFLFNHIRILFWSVTHNNEKPFTCKIFSPAARSSSQYVFWQKKEGGEGCSTSIQNFYRQYFSFRSFSFYFKFIFYSIVHFKQ